ncbi:MAG: retropepsin-like aspartic protease [bacterium]|nr:retropepsin-like aspartic protease [bacterium]
MKFRYFKFPLPERSDFFGHSILKPIIPIGLTVGGEPFDYSALIDSGADFCIFDASIAEALGLNVRSGNRISFSGVQEAGGAEAYLHDVTILIGGARHKISIGFSYDIAKEGYGILGQKGFFDIFTVKFDYQKEEIEIKERK